MKVNWKTNLNLCISLFMLYLCITYWPSVVQFVGLVVSAAIPLIIGAVIAYGVNILMSFFEGYYPNNFKAKRPVCMIGAFLTLVFVVYVLMRMVIPQLVDCIGLIFSTLPGTIKTLITDLEDWQLISDEIALYLNNIDWESSINQVFNILKNGAGNVMGVVVNTVSTILSGITTAVIALIFAIYLLSGKETLISQFHSVTKHYLPHVWYKKLCYILNILNENFQHYIVGQCIEAVIIGVLCTIGMLILRLPYASMIGVLIGFTALIPVAGAYIGGAIGALMIFSVSPIQAIVFLVYLLILQQVEGNLIYPRVVGSSMGLPGIWVLVAVIIGGGIAGMLGMLVSVPLVASIYRIVKEDIHEVGISQIK